MSHVYKETKFINPHYTDLPWQPLAKVLILPLIGTQTPKPLRARLHWHTSAQLALVWLCLPWLCYRETVGGVNAVKQGTILLQICIFF